MAPTRSVLITGCSDGSLGAALARAFHKAGWRVIVSARNVAKLKDSAAAGLETVQLDVTSDESVANAVSRVKELTGGSLDALVNNAGAGYCLPLLDVEFDKMRDLFELNVYSVLRVTQGFFPLLVKSTHSPKVINNISGSGLVCAAMPFHGAYGASKAATASMSEVLRLELQPFGIKVVSIITGSVKSNFFDAATSKLPPNSVYNAGKERIEEVMSSADQDTNGTDPDKWAAEVVRDIDTSKYWIFRGKYSLTARIVTLLPIGTLDSIMKKMTGLDVFEQKLVQQGGPEKIVLP